MRSLNLVVLRCQDLEKSRTFYECFGMKFQKHSHGGGPEHFAHEDDEGVFELYPAKKLGEDRTGLGFAAVDLTSTFSQLKAVGFVPEPIQEQSWGRTFVVRDPDGRRVEVKQA